MKAFITGITGQDGSYLAELLISKGYEVQGIISSLSSTSASTLSIGDVVVEVDPKYFRPTEVEYLKADITEVIVSQEKL